MTFATTKWTILINALVLQKDGYFRLKKNNGEIHMREIFMTLFKLNLFLDDQQETDHLPVYR